MICIKALYCEEESENGSQMFIKRKRMVFELGKNISRIILRQH